MNRLGGMDSIKALEIALLLFTLGLVIWGVSFGGFKKIDFVMNLLPGFNNSAPDGTSIVGVNMETGGLEYFTGDKWREIDSKTDKFVLGSYEVDPSILNNKISSFYLDSERRPKEFSLEINSWRYWDVYMWGLDFKRVSFVRPKVKEGFVNTERILVKGESLEIGYDNDGEIKPKDLQDVDLNIGYLPRFAEVEVDENPQAVAQVISWRDSILEDNKCEKFLDLTVKVNKEEKPLRYAVRKVDNYIFIDLNKPVYEGKKQEWDKEDCFGVENYEDDKNVDVDLKYSVKVNFKEKGDYFFSKDIDSFVVFDSLKNSWSYFNFGQIARDEYSRLHGSSLYEGIILLRKLKMRKKGIAYDSLMNIMLWVIILILAGLSLYFLFKRFGLR